MKLNACCVGFGVNAQLCLRQRRLEILQVDFAVSKQAKAEIRHCSDQLHSSNEKRLLHNNYCNEKKRVMKTRWRPSVRSCENTF